jgi:hypothetical protein
MAGGVVSLLCWSLLGLTGACVDEQPRAAESILSRVGAGTINLSTPLRYYGQLRDEPEKLPWGVGYDIGYAGDSVSVLTQAKLPQVFRDEGAFGSGTTGAKIRQPRSFWRRCARRWPSFPRVKTMLMGTQARNCWSGYKVPGTPVEDGPGWRGTHSDGWGQTGNFVFCGLRQSDDRNCFRIRASARSGSEQQATKGNRRPLAIRDSCGIAQRKTHLDWRVSARRTETMEKKEKLPRHICRNRRRAERGVRPLPCA